MVKVRTLNEIEADVFGDYYLGDKEKIKKVVVGDLPFMISHDNKLICFPREKMESFKVGVFGMTRSGKTLILHAIVDRIRWYWYIPICVINDFLVETAPWARKNVEFIRALGRLGEEPFPLPIVHVYLQHKDIKIYVNPLTVPNVRMSISVAEVIDNPTLYMRLTESAQIHLRKERSKLEECSSKEEVISIIENSFKGALFDTLKNHILVAAEDLLEEDFVDITASQKVFEFSGAPSASFKTKLKDGKIFQASAFPFFMNIGLIPVLMTRDFLHKRYSSAIIASILRKLFDFPKKYHKKCVIACPEISTISSTEDRDNPANDELVNIASRGGLEGVGLIYDTQHYTRVEKKIRQNTAYIIVFVQKSETANEIKKDFGLGKQEVEWMVKLKKYECLACTQETFAVYDFQGNRELTNEHQRGYSIPPLSLHKRPNV